MKKIQILLVAVVAALSSCTTYSYTSRSINVNRWDAEQNANYTDLDIHYDQRVTATSDWHRYRSAAIEEANHRALEQNNIDVLVDPIYAVTIHPFASRRRFSAQVIGYAAYYKVGQNDFDRFVGKDIKMEDIEKFHILNNPELLESYYRHLSEGNEGGNQQNVYYIKCGKEAPAKPHIAAPAKPVVSKPAAAKRHGKHNRKQHHEIHIN